LEKEEEDHDQLSVDWLHCYNKAPAHLLLLLRHSRYRSTSVHSQ